MEEAFREVMMVSTTLLWDGGLSAKGDVEELEKWRGGEKDRIEEHEDRSIEW